MKGKAIGNNSLMRYYMKINNHPIYNDGNQACYVVLMYAYLFIIIIIFFNSFYKPFSVLK